MTEFAMLMNGYDLNFDQEGPVTNPLLTNLTPTLNYQYERLVTIICKVMLMREKTIEQAVQIKSDSKDTSCKETQSL